MSSPGQKRGSCGHAMASFDGHSFCARCHDKGKGEEPCISNKDTTNCKFCNSLTPEQRMQLATPSYKIKKEKSESKRADSNPADDSSLVDPATISVIGAVGDSCSAEASSAPTEKKSKKDKIPAKVKKSVESTSTDSKISQWEEKWSERFNKLEALLLAKSFQPTFSSEVCLSPTHSPPSGITKDSEPFFQATNRPVDISPVKRTGPDTDAALQQSAGKLHPDKDTYGQVSSECTGPDIHALQHQSAGKLKSDPHRPRPSSSRRTGPDFVAKHQSTGKPVSDRPTVCPQNLLLPNSSQPANYPSTDLHHTDLAPTDLVPLVLLALNHHLCRLADRIVSRV